MKVFIAVLFACVLCLTIEASKDKRKDCAKYEGKCKVKSGKWKRWMDRNCEHTCLLHHKYAWCVDKNKNCNRYKKKCGSSKLREGQKIWMNKNCRKTCGCQPFKGCGIIEKAKGKSFSTFGASGNKIVGGKDAKRGQVPWQVGVWYTEKVLETNPDKSLKHTFCGGSLIKPNVVVTAAHCFIETGTSETKYYVMVGDLNTTKKEDHQKKVWVKKIIVHDNFDDDTYFDDIALLILEEDVAFNKDVKPICIPEKTIKEKSLCSVSGWGILSEDGRQPEHLQVVKLPAVSYATCDPVYRKIYPRQKPPVIPHTMVCAGYPKGKKDSCKGDSGGAMACPYTIKGTDTERFHLSGIVSFGKGCARRKAYGVYTNAFKYINWIREKLEWKFF